MSSYTNSCQSGLANRSPSDPGFGFFSRSGANRSVYTNPVFGFFNQSRPNRLVYTDPVFGFFSRSGPNRPVYTDPVFGFFSQSGRNRPVYTDRVQVELALLTFPLKLNLRFFLSLWFYALASPGFTPCSRSSTHSIPRASTPLVNLSTHRTLPNSLAVAAVLVPLPLSSCSLGL